MILVDVNILIYAHRKESPDHKKYLSWLETLLNSSTPFGVSEFILNSFIRICTNPRIFKDPTPLPTAFKFADSLKNHSNAVLIIPGPNHWKIFKELCLETKAHGNLITDLYLAALAIEFGCEWISNDKDFKKILRLNWRPLF